MRTVAPARAAATAALAPFPPPLVDSAPPVTVSPRPGRRGADTVMSTLTDPMTTTCGALTGLRLDVVSTLVRPMDAPASPRITVAAALALPALRRGLPEVVAG